MNLETLKTELQVKTKIIESKSRIPKAQTWLELERFNESEDFPFSISILTWVLDEEETIEDFLIKSKQFMNDLGLEFEHILIDDGSTDRTFEIATKIQNDYPQLRIYRNAKNLGPGWCTRLAVSYSTKDILFWQMADWSYDISDLKKYLFYFKQFDVVQGVRIPPQVINQSKAFKKRYLLTIQHFLERSDNFQKAFISITNYLLIRMLFRVPLLDYQNVTIYPRKLAQSLDLESSSPFTNPEMLFKSYWKGARIKQVPIGFNARKRGVAKGTRFIWLRKSTLQILFYWWKWIVFRSRPDFQSGQIHLP